MRVVERNGSFEKLVSQSIGKKSTLIGWDNHSLQTEAVNQLVQNLTTEAYLALEDFRIKSEFKHEGQPAPSKPEIYLPLLGGQLLALKISHLPKEISQNFHFRVFGQIDTTVRTLKSQVILEALRLSKDSAAATHTVRWVHMDDHIQLMFGRRTF